MLAEPITALSDYQGRKIAGIGMNLRYLEGVGATGVSSNMGEFYTALSTGMVDGVILWAEAAYQLKFYEIAPYFIDARIGASHSKVVTVNLQAWERRPAATATSWPAKSRNPGSAAKGFTSSTAARFTSLARTSGESGPTACPTSAGNGPTTWSAAGYRAALCFANIWI